MDKEHTPDKKVDDLLSEIEYNELPEGRKVDCSASENLRQFVEAQMRENAKARDEFSRMRFV